MYVKVTLTVVLFLIIITEGANEEQEKEPPPLTSPEYEKSDLQLAETRPQVRFCFFLTEKIIINFFLYIITKLASARNKRTNYFL